MGLARVPRKDSHRRQLVRQVINNAINNLLGFSSEWSFLLKTAEILTVNGADDYALPSDFARLLNVRVDGVKAPVINPQKFAEFVSRTQDNTQVDSSGQYACTIRQLTMSSFANLGYVFPMFGSKSIVGVGTGFVSEMVGRFFKASRDGEIIRVNAYVDAQEVTLSQDYTGRSIAGRVTVTSEALRTIVGSRHITNFSSSMVGRRILLEKDLSSFVILTVDTDQQIMTIDADATAATEERYSIQDEYEIDPAGVYILQLDRDASEDDLKIAVEYEAFQVPLTGDFDVPVIPSRFHQVIVYLAAVEYGNLEGGDAIDLNRYQAMADRGIATMINTEDPLGGGTYPYSAGADPARHDDEL